MKKNVRLSLLFTGLALIIAILIFVLFFFFNNRGKNFTFKEKNWINSNANNVMDISIESGLPLYSSNGEGIFYDFIKSMEKDTKLTFNVIVNSNSNYKFSNKNVVDGNDLIFYIDNYVVISSINEKINSIEEIKEQPIGVINNDKEYIYNYFKNDGLNFVNYKTITELKNDMNNTIIYAIIPLEKYINEIVYNKYNIVYQVEGLHSNYVLSLSEDNSILNSIFIKNLDKEQQTALVEYKESFFTKFKSFVLRLLH